MMLIKGWKNIDKIQVRDGELGEEVGTESLQHSYPTHAALYVAFAHQYCMNPQVLF